LKSRDVELVVEADKEGAAGRVGKLLAGEARKGAEIVLTGGSTAGRAYERAADFEPDWSRAGLWWGDERCVPPDDENSNFRLAGTALLDHLTSQPREVHRIRGEDEPDAAACAYEDELRGTKLDFVLLGLGADGHVASLFPGAPGLQEHERLVITAEPKLDPYIRRITLTPPALTAAEAVVFLVTGGEKADAVERALGGPPDPFVPGSLIRSDSGRTLAILDAEAAARLHD
jgi:6-phosphogluconolactonase